ncbi:MAG: tripartite tricarboxylate transporter substrate binding protein [Betaproteobacteria bacterium]|nr:tripartite tricarboxylate transporter substrate binding protein [Betaproteobacteria bacterium]
MKNLVRVLAVALTAAATVVSFGSVFAQGYPTKPVRIVVPFPPGGNSDIQARMIGQKLDELWGQRFVIENRPGADTIIGAEVVARAPADGYTLLFAVDATVTMNQYLHKKLPYDPIKDFAPITMVGRSTTVVSVDANTGPKTLRELVDRARANPGKLTFGSATLSSQLAGEMLKRLAGLDIVHVPYKGAAPAVQALLANEVSFIIDGLPSALPHVRAGKFRTLATTGSLLPNMPELRTISEAAGLPPFDVSSWQGFFAPAGTPAAIVERLRLGVERVVNIPEVRGKFLDNGVSINLSASPEEFAALIRRDAQVRAKAIKEAGISAQ